MARFLPQQESGPEWTVLYNPSNLNVELLKLIKVVATGPNFFNGLKFVLYMWLLHHSTDCDELFM